MPVSSGSFTVGSGGNYSGWVAAVVDISYPLTGNLTFTQISDITDTSNGSFGVDGDLGGFTLLFTSNNPHNGNPLTGWKTFVSPPSGSSADGRFILGTNAENGVVEIANLFWFVLDTLNAAILDIASVTTPASLTIQLHDLLIDGQGQGGAANSGISLGTGVNPPPAVEIWSVAIWRIGGVVGDGINSSADNLTLSVENITIQDCNDNGIFLSGSSGSGIIHNVACFDNGVADFAITDFSLQSYNASSDATATGTGSITSQSSATCFFTADDTKQLFLKAKKSGALATAGSTTTLAGNTNGIRQNFRDATTPSIGADEAGIDRGSYTVGTGGEFADWIEAADEITGPLAGDLTFTQISAVSISAAASFIVDVDSFVLKLTSDSGHAGNPNAGHLTTTDTGFVFNVTTGSTGFFEITNLFVRNTTLGSFIGFDTGGSSTAPVKLNNVLIDGAGTGDGVLVYAGALDGAEIWNVVIWDCTNGMVVDVPASFSVTPKLENITIWNCVGNGFETTGSSTDFIVQNVASFDNGTDFVLASATASMDYNASSDTTAPGGNSLISQTSSACFISTTDTNVLFLAGMGPLSTGGTATTSITANTFGIRLNSRPGADDVSIGADEVGLAINVISVSPVRSPALTAGRVVYVYGTDFQAGATVKFDSTFATNVNVIDSGTISCETPSVAAGVYDVTVDNPSGGTGTLVNGFTFDPPPTVTLVTPDKGPETGGTAITITGTGFIDPPTIDAQLRDTGFGSPIGSFLTSIVVVDPMTITAVTTAYANNTGSPLSISQRTAEAIVTNFPNAPANTQTGVGVDLFYFTTNRFIGNAAAHVLDGSGSGLIGPDFNSGAHMLLTVAFKIARSFNGGDPNANFIDLNVELTGSNPTFEIITNYNTINGIIFGTLDLSVSFDLSFGGAIDITPELPIAFIVAFSMTENIDLEVEIVVTEDFFLTRAGTNRDSEYELTGYRRSFPFLVYVLDALTPLDVASVPPNRSFLVSAAFTGGPGDPFFEAGGAANYIGTVVTPQSGPSYFVFRQPIENEVVWYVPHAHDTDCMYRYERNRDTGRFTWRAYRSQPQRNLDGQYAFSIFDPDGIYDYYACLWGALMFEWSYDTFVLTYQYDADKASHFYLPALAANYGLTLKQRDSEFIRRQKTKTAVQTFKLKGLDRGIETRLRALGFSGYAREIWVNTGAKALRLTLNYTGYLGNIPILHNNTDFPHLTISGFSGGSDNVAATAIIQFRRGRNELCPDAGEVSPVDGETITISDGTLTQTFEFDSNGSVAGGNIAVPFVLQDDIDDIFATFTALLQAQGFDFTIEDISCANVFGPPIGDEPVSSSSRGTLDKNDPVCRSDYREYPHGYSSVEPVLYWPSSRVSIHLNDRVGNPVEITPGIKQQVFDELRFDILPAQTDIRFFATDVNVNGGPEEIEATDELTITEV